MKKIESVAFHEAGHAVAYLLTEMPFNYVTIKPDEKEDEYGQKSVGHLMPNEPTSIDDWCQYTILNPTDFNIYFKGDFIKIAGSVAEMIHKGKFNNKGAAADFRQWSKTTLSDLPEKLRTRYKSFMFEYAIEVLQIKTIWSKIVAVAEALIKQETLSYDEVCKATQHKLIK